MKEPNFLKRYKQLFAQYVDLETGEIIHRAFQEEVFAIRDKEDMATKRALASGLILKYKFPHAMQSFLREFIVGNGINFGLIESNLFLVSPSGKGAVSGIDEPIEEGLGRYIVYSIRNSKIDIRALHPKTGTPKLHVTSELKLVIGKNTSIEQIVDFIRTNKQHIKQFQRQLREDSVVPTRVRPRKNLKRDMRILELKEQGKRHSEIERIIHDEFPDIPAISYGDIPSILRNLKR